MLFIEDMTTCESCESVEALILRAVEVWKHDQLVNLTTTWKQEPQGHYLAETLSKRLDCEASLGQLLSHENEIVVAYSLVALEIMDSTLLGRLPNELIERKQFFTRLEGSFAIDYELGEFAKEIQKQWFEKHRQS